MGASSAARHPGERIAALGRGQALQHIHCGEESFTLVVVVLALCAAVPAVRRDGARPGLVPARAGIPLYAAIAVVALLLSMGPEPTLTTTMRWSTGPAGRHGPR